MYAAQRDAIIDSADIDFLNATEVIEKLPRTRKKG